MFEFNKMDALIFSLLSYFDIFDYEQGMELTTFADHLLHDPQYMEQQKTDLYTLECLEFAKSFDYSRYTGFKITDYVNLNNQSGLALMCFENETTMYICLRGSEFLDKEYHRCGWEDWKDNIAIFQKVTWQQLQAIDYLNQLPTHKKIVLLGHSKGGNLSLFLSLTCSEERLAQIEHVYTFNAPGINEVMMSDYAHRAKDEAYLDKLTLFENEHDTVSSLFLHLKEPIYLSSINDNRNLQQMYHNHQLYAIKMEDDLIEAKGKSYIPKLVDSFINQLFVRLPQSMINDVLSLWNDYIESDYGMDELYHIFLYHIGKYTHIFDELDYAQIKEIEFETIFITLKKETANEIASIPKLISHVIESIKESNIENYIKHATVLVENLKNKIKL